MEKSSYIVTNYIDEPLGNVCTNPRYVIQTQGSKPIICIGINPNTATNIKPDTTVKKVLTYTMNYTDKKYDSIIMLNVYPERATTVKELPSDGNENKDLIANNLLNIKNIINNLDKPITVWCAWSGDIVDKDRKYLLNCKNDIVNLINKFSVNWVCIKETIKGFPHHPSRMHYDWKFRLYNPYIK